MTVRYALPTTALIMSGFFVEAAILIVVGMLTGAAYHLFFYGSIGAATTYAGISTLVAFGYGLTHIARGEYAIDCVLDGRRTNSRLLLSWSLVFLILAVIGFLTKSTAMVSRGWLMTFFVVGYITCIACNHGLRSVLATLLARGHVDRRKLMILGFGDDIIRLERDISDGAASVVVAASVVLPHEHNSGDADDAAFENALILAIERARSLKIQDVLISHSVGTPERVERCVQAFSLLPVAIHVGAGGLISRFKDAHVSRFGRTTTLSLMRQPLGPFDAIAKRTFDVVLATIALILLAPVFAVIAALIKWDSTGPVFFRQRRRGYNLDEFAIWKFRTMTTMDDGETVTQATKGDARVTRVGGFLRRYSLDELPQLLNVLRGDMSLVGPRPHAVAHDRIFERRLQYYPRRLNMKPGITGWAQVNGYRGATETDDAMRERLEHDLFYIDNWSISFDVYIVFLTVVSPKASMNAY